ncbi:MAG: plasmid mobilization relaxosome protein MobC [Candidatus Thiodiazotropha sp.]
MSSTPPIISLKNSKLASPFSLRLTFKERTILEQAAGDMPLGAYIRSKLLNESEVPRRVRKRTRKPLKDEQALALLLGELGKARLANNLNQLAKAANTGSLPVTPDTEKALQRACAAVQDMRDLLLQALGFPAGGAP